MAVFRQDVRPHEFERRFHVILAVACAVVVHVAVTAPALAIDQIRRDVVAAGIGCRLANGFNDPAIRRFVVKEFGRLSRFVICDAMESGVGHSVACN